MQSKTAAHPVVHLGLDIVGFIPGFGETADFANVLLYLEKGDMLQALLSAMSLMTGIGDAIAKPIKAFIMLSKKIPFNLWQSLLRHKDAIRKAILALKSVNMLSKFVSLLTDTFDSLVSGPLGDSIFDKTPKKAASNFPLVKNASGLTELDAIKEAVRLLEKAQQVLLPNNISSATIPAALQELHNFAKKVTEKPVSGVPAGRSTGPGRRTGVGARMGGRLS